jgi:hypothetical protein
MKQFDISVEIEVLKKFEVKICDFTDELLQDFKSFLTCFSWLDGDE